MKLYCTMCPAGNIANYVYNGESLCVGHYMDIRDQQRWCLEKLQNGNSSQRLLDRLPEFKKLLGD